MPKWDAPPTPSNPPVVPGSIVTITEVKANPTDKGVEVILFSVRLLRDVEDILPDHDEEYSQLK
ncbi:hypothetical protein [Nostoc sp. UHCC 0870]|uniref:hypothetical protein n=1 Tax=Nostoc sp. UHCC 0870 TaxID=2914041 RepID=UPI001EDE1F76|nr:hypothetical protein [Nostoc sp. UHCC 0870]UKO96880.1 hypothetical protein L6494_20065 [Nostoc sp. UHCC 0870]